jgi:uncharacterized protein (TIGR02246 family)
MEGGHIPDGDNAGSGSTIEDLVMRVERLEQREAARTDEDAIHALFMEYGRLLDAQDFERMSQCFADDATIVSAAGVGTATGPSEIRDLFAMRLKDVPPKAYHVYTNIEINVDGDSATAGWFWTYLWPDETGHPTILQFGHYDDVLVRTDAGWKFQSREITRDMGFLPYTKED